MSNIKISEFFPNLSIPSERDSVVTGVSIDSRHVQTGDLFLAYVGFKNDGRQYIADAIAKGAAAVFAEGDEGRFELQSGVPIYYVHELNQKIAFIAAKFFRFPADQLRIVGITGTNGKTSCSHFVAQMLQVLGWPCGVIGTLGIGLSGQVHAGSLTTPDALTLQRTFADFLQQGAKAVAMEVSSHSLDQGRVNGIPFEVGIFTNLTRDHLDYHGSMEAYGAVKRRLFDNPLLKHAVINIDDAFGLSMVQDLRATQDIYAYSVTKPEQTVVPTVYTENLHLDISGFKADVVTPWGKGVLQTALVGQFNLSNVLAVLTTLCVMDVPLALALTAMRQLKPVSGRMETYGGGDQPLVVVDYAHTPDSLEKVLMALRKHCQGDLFCLFGCGGDRDKGKRPLMAGIAERLADRVWLTDDNPRHEASEQIAADVLAGFQDPSSIIVELDRSKAIQDIIQCAKVGDCVLIAGRGGETHQQVGDQKIPFDDAEKVALIMSRN